MNFYLGQTVYHGDVYEHKEPLTIVGIRENELELEGDFSGGTHNIIQRDWLPMKGISTVYNYKYKKECRDFAVAVLELARPIQQTEDTAARTMFDLLHMVFVLTSDVSLNPECE